MNGLNLDLEPFEFDFELDEFSDEHEGSCSQSASELELDELEIDLGDSEWEEEVRRRGRRFTRPLRRPRKIRPRPQPAGGALRPKPRPRPPWRPKRPIIVRPGRQRPVVIREPAAPCVCPAHRTEFVRWVQSSLNQVLGLQLPVTGVMNRATRDVLRDFQKREGLAIDGIAGPETEKALIDAKRGQSGQGEELSEFEALEEFGLDLADLELEGEVSSTPTPGRYYQIKKGDNLLKIAGLAYRAKPGTRERLEGARRINKDPKNQKFFRAAESDNLFPSGKVSFLPRFACDLDAQIKAKGKVPRGHCYAVLWIPGGSDPGLRACLDECERDFQRCRDRHSQFECWKRKRRCKRDCRGRPA